MLKGILKELKEALTATPMPQPPEGVIPIQQDNLVVGTNYKCKKNKSMNRRDVIRGMRTGSPVYIEPSTYNGKPSYLVVDGTTGIDCGVISPGSSEWLADHYPADTVMTGEVVEMVNGAPRIVYNVYAK